MLNKRGELTTKEILEIVLAVAVVFVLVVLMYRLISPNFDKADETTRAYLDSFKKVISDGGGSFSMWQPEEDDKEFYLAYFQNRTSFGEGREFLSFGNNVNHVCVCSWEGGDVKCENCDNLDWPLVKDGNFGGTWAITTGEEIEIKKKDGYYEIVA